MKTIQQDEPVFGCRNAMEELVLEEIERQFRNLPPELVQSINPIDVLTYALNRLPPLYASTEEGYEWQQQQARKSMKGFIYRMVKLSVKVSQRKAKVFSAPLKISPQSTWQNLQLLSENS